LVCYLLLAISAASAGQGAVYRCATTAEVHAALKIAAPGDTIVLEGGKVYETDKTFKLESNGTESNRITFTSKDSTGQGRYAVITTVGQRKEEDLVALKLTGPYWNVSRLEIAGKRVPLEDGYWDTNGFRIGIYLDGPESHDNVVEDVLIHHTHNTAGAVRDRAHDNVFRRMHIHHIGEWLSADYNAHEGEGFYIGSSKGFDEREYNAIAHDILIEDSVLGPGLLGQFIDLKYAASNVTVRNNVLHCGEKTYNQEIVSLAGYANTIAGNRFVGSNENLARYIRVFNKKTKVPVTVNYKGETGIPAPTGRDNTIKDNVFYTNGKGVVPVSNELRETDRASLLVEGNRILPLNAWENPG
jgi:hypothetical protein